MEEAFKNTISEIGIIKVDSEGRLKAYCSFLIDGVFAVHDARIIEGKNGLFVAMPSRKNKDGKYQDICYPTSDFFRKEITKKVLEEYQKQV